MEEEILLREENKDDLVVFLDRLFPGLHDKHIFTGQDFQKHRIALTLNDSPERHRVEQDLTVGAMSLRSTSLSFLELSCYEGALHECIPELMDSYFLKYTLLSLAQLYLTMVRSGDSIPGDVSLNYIDDAHTYMDINTLLSNEYKNEEFNNLIIFINKFYSRLAKGLGRRTPQSKMNRALIFDTTSKKVFAYDRNFEWIPGSLTDKDDFKNRPALMPGVFTLLYASNIESVPSGIASLDRNTKLSLKYPELSKKTFEGVKPEMITLKQVINGHTLRQINMVRSFPDDGTGTRNPVVDIYYTFEPGANN